MVGERGTRSEAGRGREGWVKREGGREERGRKGKQCKWRVMEEEPEARRGKGGRDGESEKESEREWQRVGRRKRRRVDRIGKGEGGKQREERRCNKETQKEEVTDFLVKLEL